MKRNDFLRNFATIAGGLTVLSCDKNLVGEFMADIEGESISISEAKSWFDKVYLSKYAAVRMGGNGGYRRESDWKKAKKIKYAGKQDAVWVPLNYQDDKMPSIVSWGEKTGYRKKLSEYYVYPILEGLIVYKEKNETKSFLAQIAYDPYVVRNNSYQLELSKFTGWLVRADWDDNLMDGFVYDKGQIIGSFDKEKEKRGRIQQQVCTTQTIEYQTVETRSCGPNCTDVTVTLHRSTQTVCVETGGSGGGGGGSTYEAGTGGGGNSPIGSTTIIFETFPIQRNYNLQNVITRPGPDRTTFNQSLSDAVYATGLALNILDFTFDKAEACARAVGGNIDEFFPLANVVGTRIGVAGLVIDGVQLYMGVAQNGFQWNQDGWNAVQVGLSIAGLAAGTVFAAPWVAVATGVVSIGIAIGTR